MKQVDITWEARLAHQLPFVVETKFDHQRNQFFFKIIIFVTINFKTQKSSLYQKKRP